MYLDVASESKDTPMAWKLFLLRRLSSSVLKSPSSSFSSVRRSCLPNIFLPEASSFDFYETTHASSSFKASRSFCSRPLNLVEDSQGPAAIDYSTLLLEDEYHRLADSTIQGLQEKFEEYGDSVQIDGFDIDYGSSVLTLKLGTLGTYVLNKQTPNRQIWLSSPVSGPSRFDWDQSDQAWVYRRNKANLLKVLESELEQLCDAHIRLS